MKKFTAAVGGFTLIEIAVSLGVAAFALVVVFALLPLGIKSNRESADESRATMILSNLEADLRNGFRTTDGLSKIFHLPQPYLVDQSGRVEFDRTLKPEELHTVGLNEAENPVPITAQRVPFQASVVYMQPPPVGSRQSFAARLIVSWPSIQAATASDVTSAKVAGSVEAVIHFPSP